MKSNTSYFYLSAFSPETDEAYDQLANYNKESFDF